MIIIKSHLFKSYILSPTAVIWQWRAYVNAFERLNWRAVKTSCVTSSAIQWYSYVIKNTVMKPLLSRSIMDNMPLIAERHVLIRLHLIPPLQRGRERLHQQSEGWRGRGIFRQQLKQGSWWQRPEFPSDPASMAMCWKWANKDMCGDLEKSFHTYDMQHGS